MLVVTRRGRRHCNRQLVRYWRHVVCKAPMIMGVVKDRKQKKTYQRHVLYVIGCYIQVGSDLVTSGGRRRSQGRAVSVKNNS